MVSAWRVVPFLAVVIVACAGGQVPATTLQPPMIQIAGLIASASQANDTFELMFEGGRAFSGSTLQRRVLNQTPVGDMVIVGTDAVGPFVAAYMRQGGLPQDCFVDNSPGIDRGPFIELRGVLWRKSVDFQPAQLVGTDYPYPGSTRFCFSSLGEISSTVSP